MGDSKMSVIGFNFRNINVETKKAPAGNININSNVSIEKVEKAGLNLGNDKQATLKFDFVFTVKYDPELADIKLKGDLLWLTDKKKAEDVAKSWKEKKFVPADIMEEVMNTILIKSNIESLILSQQVNLPPPIRLPRVKAEAKEEKPAKK